MSTFHDEKNYDFVDAQGLSFFKYNITTKRKFVKTISEFGARRDSFDVGFIFYAGHGMQVDGKNYLLPTKEE